MARAALVGWLALSMLQLAACRGILGIDEDRIPLVDAALEPTCTRSGLQCAGEDVLRMCAEAGARPLDQPCAWGCMDVGDPHCAELRPSGGAVEWSDLQPNSALAATIISDPVAVNTDTGAITTIRTPGEGISSGIGFIKRRGVALFTFAGLVIDGAISVNGSLPVAFVASGDIAVNKLIDLRGGCASTAPGPGGWPGGDGSTPAPGIGGGGSGNLHMALTTGGGGGGHGAPGGKGATGTGVVPGGSGGTSGGDTVISQLRGGWGGGGGGAYLASGGVGGGGGGAIQLVSNGLVTFGGATGGINAGGCGGKHGVGTSAGGGGGAGGTILVEAPIVRLDAVARLAANGGGGGGGRDGTDGAAGLADTTAASGGAGGPLGGAGGVGGTSAKLAGTDGVPMTHSGGGGGGTGRIRFNTRRGAIDAHASARISPSLAAPATAATQGTASTK